MMVMDIYRLINFKTNLPVKVMRRIASVYIQFKDISSLCFGQR
jgi:hypothetical protein